MDFQTKVVNAMVQVEKGCSLKDFLDDEEIIQALSMFADILVITGVLPTEEEYEPWVKTYSGGEPNYTQPIESVDETLRARGTYSGNNP